jgi:hypothetical protein
MLFFVVTMEILKTSFVFLEGEISNYNLLSEDPGVLAVMHEVNAILRPTIEQNKLSGKVILTILTDRLCISYENIMPFEFTPVLMQIINSTN